MKTENENNKTMTVLEFLKNPIDRTDFDMLTIIGIDKNAFYSDIFRMMYEEKYARMSCKELREEIEREIFGQEKDYLYIYENCMLKDTNCSLPFNTKNKCYNGRANLINKRNFVVPTIIGQMQSEEFCQKNLFLCRKVLYFKYYETNYNNSPNQLGLKIYCWVNEN